MSAVRRAGVHGPRTFDPVVLGHRETDAWASYYRHEWPRALRAFVGMVAEGFGLGPRLTLVGAWYVLRANQAWAPVPDNDPEAARRFMEQFYELVAAHTDLRYEPRRAAELEVGWWRVHRAHQYDPEVHREDLERAVIDLYAYVYGSDPAAMMPAARLRVDAMDLSDRWVAAGCDLEDPLLAAERRALVASYAALRDAVSRAPEGTWPA
jgi:hypothetical protein